MLTANATDVRVKQKLAKFYSRFLVKVWSMFLLCTSSNIFFRVAAMYGFSPTQWINVWYYETSILWYKCLYLSKRTSENNTSSANSGFINFPEKAIWNNGVGNDEGKTNLVWLRDTCKFWMNPQQQVIAILPQIIELSFVFPFGTAVGALWFPFSAVAVAWTLAILNPVWFYHGFNFTKKHSTTSLCHCRARKGNKLTLEILRSCSDIMRWFSANLTWPQLKQIDGPVLTESEFVLT